MELYRGALEKYPYLKELDPIINEIFLKVINSGKRSVLLQGYVQSGKTGAYLALVAKMIDEGYKKIFIITKSSLSLAWQTEKRVLNFLKMMKIPSMC
ncbi:hypothetical protein B1B04_10370 [Lysinibacillus sp. KCTC 33748]|uniref:DEAD/DEAH box helicase family protein n=1 Tax=unclassified Lysinibacillus TaxID=2636778 RepID=UPI0009A89388|nr:MULTISPECIES: DEAD/DEAH box helicase family protein [unclassified Lysinibacillus]OXS74009.1 hypothetical protein B1B04_10370 [Lysinibacillus sp. KCTC 33748]SKB69134.1 hypothetical protein SAMN06295926_10631 [Lysinibacillus sp. AC-3]